MEGFCVQSSKEGTDGDRPERERKREGGGPDGALSEPVLLVLVVALVVRVKDQRAIDSCGNKRASESSGECPTDLVRKSEWR